MMTCRACFFTFFVLGCLAVDATDGFYYMDLEVKPQGEVFALEWTPQRLMSYKQFRDPAYHFSGFIEHSYDVFLQEAVLLLKELDGKRKQLKIKSKQPFLVTSFMFGITVREVSGKPLGRHGFHVELSLPAERGVALVSFGERQALIQLADLTSRDGYLRFLDLLESELALARIKTPNKDRFMVECYYSNIHLAKDLVKIANLEGRGLQAYRVLFRANTYGNGEHLGTTFCQIRDGRLPQVRSGHLKFFQKANDLYAETLQKKKRGEPISRDLETYLGMVATDAGALGLLVPAYIAENRKEDAFNFIVDYRPLLSENKEVMTIFNQLVRERESERFKLLEEKDSFTRDDNIELTMISPVQNDWVGGDSKLVFDMVGNRSDILRVDAVADDEVVGSIIEPPFAVPFRLNTDQGRVTLKLLAYFKDRTYQETSIKVKPIFIDKSAEHSVRLATLRVSATQGVNNYLLNLRPVDFVVSELGDTRPIHNFRRDRAPLRVAILIDTSGSMSGDKLYRAQSSANAFLSKLEPEDRACIYTFDHNVMKLSDFTNEFESMQSVMLTLSPHHSTSLNDALVRANQDLLKMDGNRVIIVVSDGRDSASEIPTDKVFSLFRRSPVMVYSIVLDLNQGSNREGKEYMDKLSRMTGSASLDGAEQSDLEESFTKIYEELTSFYLIDFYSSQKEFKLKNIQVRVRLAGVQTRFSRLRDFIGWE